MNFCSAPSRPADTVCWSAARVAGSPSHQDNVRPSGVSKDAESLSDFQDNVRRPVHRCIDSRVYSGKGRPTQRFNPASTVPNSGSNFSAGGFESPCTEQKIQDLGTSWEAGLSFDEILFAVSCEVTKQLDLLRAAHLQELRFAGSGEIWSQQRPGVFQKATDQLARLSVPVDELAKSTLEVTSPLAFAAEPPEASLRAQRANPTALSDESDVPVPVQQTPGLTDRGAEDAAAPSRFAIAPAAPIPENAPVGLVPLRTSSTPTAEFPGISSQKHSELTQEEADLSAKAQTMFTDIDEDQDGIVTADEFHACLCSYGIDDLSKKDIEDTFAAINLHAYGGQGVDPLMRRGHCLQFAEFKDLVANEEYDLELLGDATAHKVHELRQSLSRCNMSKLILQATGVDQTRLSTKPSSADAIDCCVGLAILMNTLILGIAADISWGGWPYVFLIFTMIYFAEVIIKVYILGPSAYFCGADAIWNYTDLLFTGLAIGDSMIVLFQEGDGNSIKGLVLLRLVRLTRLTRLIKLLRLRMFKELQLMLRGILVGMSTLGWSLGLFLFLVYILALMIRFLLGPTQGELPSDSPQCNPADEWCLRSQEMIDLHYEELFSDTPRCVLTILRCFTDGCASVDGTPLIPTLFNIYGYPLLITYVFCMFFMTFGLFNLIIAIMVESTIETAKSQRFRGIDYYREEQLAIAQKMKKILQRTSDFCHDPEPVAGKTSWESRLPDIWIFNLFRVKDNLKQILSDMNSLLITPKVFKKLIWDPEISEVLDDLEISSANREGFFDVIDADGSGSISAEELITGLLRLRGSVAEKSDAVGILLSLRVIQRDLKNNVKPMIHAIANLGQRTCDRVSHLENRMQGSL